ncbi:MAG: recombination mediator RecR [Dehalococcoidales bacterium]|nr:recombination protein RecR [Dehalococcoidales bacterium]MDP6042893.1 recombination mediator RecR [Dehalococcoidales bacterium]MDP6576747.1 recombination mediator RecR [Dehalococcoidales bacterium]MDP6824898.1 recombination mediator RecR [Dehalococcoidales bacterium]MDP7285798.1 recombination mediator RecR [Dehalococcoidales bacterium]
MNHGFVPTTNAIDKLVQEFNKLPGIGPKSAQRLAFHLLRAPEEQVEILAEAILTLKQKITLCSVCLNVTESDPCSLCRNDQRDRSAVCIVEQPQDILALEHTGIYKGLYHVLHGAISPTEGMGADDIRIKELISRLQDGRVKEIILATNPTLEGEQTALYLNHLISPLNIKVTRLARGLPFGTELEYADDITLTRAIEGRQEF